MYQTKKVLNDLNLKFIDDKNKLEKEFSFRCSNLVEHAQLQELKDQLANEQDRKKLEIEKVKFTNSSSFEKDRLNLLKDKMEEMNSCIVSYESELIDQSINYKAVSKDKSLDLKLSLLNDLAISEIYNHELLDYLKNEMSKKTFITKEQISLAIVLCRFITYIKANFSTDFNQVLETIKLENNKIQNKIDEEIKEIIVEYDRKFEKLNQEIKAIDTIKNKKIYDLQNLLKDRIDELTKKYETNKALYINERSIIESNINNSIKEKNKTINYFYKIHS